MIIQFSTFLEGKTLIAKRKYNASGVPLWHRWAFILPTKPLSLTIITPLAFFTVGTYLDMRSYSMLKGISVGFLNKNNRWLWRWERTEQVGWDYDTH